MMAGKPKYYLRESYNQPEWLVICQGSNNVVIAEVANQVLADLFLEFLNELPGRRQPKVKEKAMYPHLKKKNTSE